MHGLGMRLKGQNERVNLSSVLGIKQTLAITVREFSAGVVWYLHFLPEFRKSVSRTCKFQKPFVSTVYVD
jgi:hypothetical protein